VVLPSCSNTSYLRINNVPILDYYSDAPLELELDYTEYLNLVTVEIFNELVEYPAESLHIPIDFIKDGRKVNIIFPDNLDVE
jgi:hypothetical protein